jgi:hypothetical protein
MLINPQWNQVEGSRLASCESRSISIAGFSHSNRSRRLKGTMAKYPVGVARTMMIKDKSDNKR